MIKEIGTRTFYTAEVVKVVERSGKNGPYLLWEFQDENGEKRVGFTDIDIVLGDRTWTWLKMLGISARVGEKLELDSLTGVECYIFLDDKGIVRMVDGAGDTSKIQVEAPSVVEELKSGTRETLPVKQEETPTRTLAQELFD